MGGSGNRKNHLIKERISRPGSTRGRYLEVGGFPPGKSSREGLAEGKRVLKETTNQGNKPARKKK